MLLTLYLFIAQWLRFTLDPAGAALALGLAPGEQSLREQQGTSEHALNTSREEDPLFSAAHGGAA